MWLTLQTMYVLRHCTLVSDAVMSTRVLHSSPIKAAFVEKYTETGASDTVLDDIVAISHDDVRITDLNTSRSSLASETEKGNALCINQPKDL